MFFKAIKHSKNLCSFTWKKWCFKIIHCFKEFISIFSREKLLKIIIFFCLLRNGIYDPKRKKIENILKASFSIIQTKQKINKKFKFLLSYQKTKIFANRLKMFLQTNFDARKKIHLIKLIWHFQSFFLIAKNWFFHHFFTAFI